MEPNFTKRTRIKMCGTTRREDAIFAVQQGVDALGFIFYEKSPRNITIDQAKEIISCLPPFVDKVGVFVNEKKELVCEASLAGLSALQLHGTETVDYCRELKSLLPHCALIKAFRVGSKSRADEFADYADCVDAFLLDTYVKGAKGGTGEVFDWSVIDSLKLGKPFILAGGLTPENTKKAVMAACPYAVDINSGVEISPGVKDHMKLAAVVDSLRI